jgi:hypothetical protein
MTGGKQSRCQETPDVAGPADDHYAHAISLPIEVGLMWGGRSTPS